MSAPPVASVLDSVLGAVPLPLILVGRNARIAAINAAAETLLGSRAQGRHFTAVMRAPALVEAVEAALETGREARARQVAPTASGRVVAWRVLAAPLGPGQGVLVSFTDVSSEEAADRLRREFVANVSHELKTPLTALMGFIETLRGPARDDAAARERFLATMAAEAERMERLVNDLLSLARVEAEERVRPGGRVDLLTLLGQVAAALRPLAEERGVDLELDARADLAPVPGDADRLTQVFANLAENALKYGASGKRVTLRLGSVAHDPVLRGPAAKIEVIDRGEGFDPIHIPRLTERFYRIDRHRARAEGGTGLGLAIVKHIVARHRGRLSIDSAPGQGSRFTVTLPAAEPEPRTENAQPS